jgi:hypothetical protein
MGKEQTMSDQMMSRGVPAAHPPQGPSMRGGLGRWFHQLNDDTDEDDGDLASGQVVIVAARWILVTAGLVLALWNPAAIGPLRLQVLVLLLIAVANFFLHSQLLRKRGMVSDTAYLASAADLGVISLLVATQGGFDSNLFVFYFPAMLALSVAFRPKLTALYGGATVAAYALICLQSVGRDLNSDHVQTIFVRTLMLAAVAVCGALYQRIERDRRSGELAPEPAFDEVPGA